MNILDLLKGKEVIIKTDALVDVKLIIDNVEQLNRSVDLEPATQANDWWPASRDWVEYKVKFTNGYSKIYHSLNEMNII